MLRNTSLRPRGAGAVHARRLAAVLVLGGALSASCASTGDDPQDYGSPEVLVALQPGDVAVAPLQNLTGDPTVPVPLLREALSQALVERLYSPLDPEYVDGNWIESSFRGTPPPDAVLVVSLHRWDEDELFVTGVIQAKAQLVLFEGGNTTGALLWGRDVDLELDMRGGHAAPPGPSPGLIPLAALRFAREALETLPSRDPLAAHP